MVSTLPKVSQEHHARLVQHIDRMPAVGDLIGGLTAAELEPHVSEVNRFLTGLFIPHMEATEATLYPELERLLQNRHSMTPMRREHAEIRALVEEFGRQAAELKTGRLTTGQAVALRRSLFRLYALLKIHVAEEQLYQTIIEHGVADAPAELLAAAMAHPGIGEF
jgi:hemerythrin-like domain-containing protein